MEILNKSSLMPQNVSLILGFFDGIHLGHKKVIEKAFGDYKTVLITFKKSPAEFFGKNIEYIYPRNISYNFIQELGVDYIVEYDFSEIANLSADEYLKFLIENFNPKVITTGFNHTFGYQKKGNPKLLEELQEKFSYKYNVVSEFKKEGTTVCSTEIKYLLQKGDIEKANDFLGHNFRIESLVIEGAKIGREIGFPTANLEYPKEIVRIPYGVYSARVFGRNAILNWGIKPTFGTYKEIVEVHIVDYQEDLYNKNLSVEIIKKIRDEKRFNNIEELKKQIKKDIDKCLE